MIRLLLRLIYRKTIIIYIFNLIDLACTYYLYAKFGVEIESNPVGVWLLQNPLALIIYKALIIGAACYLLYRYRKNRLCTALTVGLLCIFSALTVYHAVILITLALI